MRISRFVDLDSNVFLFFLFLSVIFGAAFGFSDVYNHMSNVDIQTYVGLSEFDFDQHPVRRYRVIVPFLASIVHLLLAPIFTIISPNDFPGDFPRIMSFVVVNSTLMAIYAILLFRICQSILGDSSTCPAFIGVLSVLTCRWTYILAGSALVDSLYLITLGLLLLGILKNRLWMLVLAVYLGPWAKEAFIFFVDAFFAFGVLFLSLVPWKLSLNIFLSASFQSDFVLYLISEFSCDACETFLWWFYDVCYG